MRIDRFRIPKFNRILLAGATAVLLTLGIATMLSNGAAMAQPLSDETEITELVCSKEVNLLQAKPGEVLTYLITIQNTGEAAGTILVTDSLPVELDCLPASVSADFGTLDVTDNLIAWEGDFSGFGQTNHITISAEITSDISSQPVWITNTAEITGAGTLTEVSAVTQVADTYYYYMPVVNRNYPPIPSLNVIPQPDENGNYTVSWVAVDWSGVDGYVLQESTNSSFSSITNSWTTAGTSRAIQHPLGSGTFYYRVRADDSEYWGEGPYSNIRSVSLPLPQPSYYYDFNHSGTIYNPWPIRRTSYWQGDVGRKATWTEQPADYTDSIFIIMADRFDFALASPMEEAPDPPYVIETRVRIHEPGNLASYGIVFGGNGGSPCPAYRDTGCFSHYYRLDTVWNGTSLKAAFKRIDYHEPESSSSRGAGRGAELINYQYVTNAHTDWHTWRFVVKPTGIDIYFDGSLYGSTNDTTYVNEPYFGIWVSANEYKPAIGRFDYFNVVPQ